MKEWNMARTIGDRLGTTTWESIPVLPLATTTLESNSFTMATKSSVLWVLSEVQW